MFSKRKRYKISMVGLSKKDKKRLHQKIFDMGIGWRDELDDQFTYISPQDYLFIEDGKLTQGSTEKSFLEDEGILVENNTLIFTDIYNKKDLNKFKKEMQKYV